jgi:hypothetical protein
MQRVEHDHARRNRHGVVGGLPTILVATKDTQHCISH